MPIYSTILTHITLVNATTISVSLALLSHTVKKPNPFHLAQQCQVLCSHKGGAFVMALLSVPVPDAKLCALLPFSPPYGAESHPSSLSTGRAQLGAQTSLAGGHTGEDLGGSPLFTC